MSRPERGLEAIRIGDARMGMADVARIIEWLLGLWLFGLMALIVWRMLSGSILLTGLLRLEPKAPFGFDRLQLLAVTLLFAGGYAVAALAQDPGEGLPDISMPIMLVLMGSHGTYLAARVAAFTGRSRGRS
jgi:hypothetical protein